MEIKSPFDIVNVINSKTADFEEDTLYKVYTPFMVNRALSNHIETVFFANEMNQRWNLDKELQFDFYYNGVPKGKRYGKWNKKVADSLEISALQTYFCINRSRAEEYLKMLPPEQLEMIITKVSKGGVR